MHEKVKFNHHDYYCDSINGIGKRVARASSSKSVM